MRLLTAGWWEEILSVAGAPSRMTEKMVILERNEVER